MPQLGQAAIPQARLQACVSAFIAGLVKPGMVQPAPIAQPDMGRERGTQRLYGRQLFLVIADEVQWVEDGVFERGLRDLCTHGEHGSGPAQAAAMSCLVQGKRSEAHLSELKSLMRTAYA